MWRAGSGLLSETKRKKRKEKKKEQFSVDRYGIG